jgi:hypothetical protein
MKINEVSQPSDKKLFESIDHDNKTGFATEDLVKIVRTEKNNEWSKPMTMEELFEEMDSWE